MTTRAILPRRHFSAVVMAGLFTPTLKSIAEAEPPHKYVIDGLNLKNIDDLVAAMRKAAGSRIPPTVQAKEFYKAIAEAFVRNIHAIADAGVRVPHEMLEKLEKRKVIIPIMVMVVVWGVTFLVPMQAIGELVLGSLAVMGLFVWAAISSLSGDKKAASV